MNLLPDEILREIIFYTKLCKKDNNFYVNKRFYNASKDKICKCKKFRVLKHNFCMNCDKKTISFINTYFYGDEGINLF